MVTVFSSVVFTYVRLPLQNIKLYPMLSYISFKHFLYIFTPTKLDMNIDYLGLNHQIENNIQYLLLKVITNV